MRGGKTRLTDQQEVGGGMKARLTDQRGVGGARLTDQRGGGDKADRPAGG